MQVCQADEPAAPIEANETVTNFADSFEIHVPHELLGSWTGSLFTAATEEKLMPDMEITPDEGFHSHMWQKPGRWRLLRPLQNGLCDGADCLPALVFVCV